MFTTQLEDAQTPKKDLFGLKLLAMVLVAAIVFMSIPVIQPIHAANSYKVEFSTTNFGIQFLHAQKDDLSNPQHTTFTLTNGSALWYGIEVQSQPGGIQPVAANPLDDLLSSSLAHFGLLPPNGLVPINTDGTFFENIHLAASFSSSGQEMTLTLNPFNKTAAAFDILNLLLQLLGEVSPNIELGLLATSSIQQILTTIDKTGDFVTLINDYVSLLQATLQHSNAVLGKANACAIDLFKLFATKANLAGLVKILTLLVGSVIPGIAPTVASYATGIHGFLVILKLTKFLADLALSLGSYLFQQDTFPTVQLQSVSTATATSLPTTVLSPSPTLSPTILTTVTVTSPTESMISVSPTSINANTGCTWSAESVGWSCKVMVSNSQNALASLNWSASSSGIDTQGFVTSFSQASGTLAPGQSAQVSIFIDATSHHSCSGQGFTGSLTFTSSANTVTIPWSCTTPTLAVSPGSLNGNTDCSSSDAYGPWTCNVTVSQQSQGEMTWSTNSNGISGITFNPDSGRFVGPGMPTQVTITIPTATCPASAQLLFNGDANTITVPWKCTPPLPKLIPLPGSFNPSACTAIQGGWQCQMQLLNSASDTQPDNYFTSGSNLPGVIISPSSGTISSSQYLPVTLFIPSTDCRGGILYFYGKWNTATVSWTCP